MGTAATLGFAWTAGYRAPPYDRLQSHYRDLGDLKAIPDPDWEALGSIDFHEEAIEHLKQTLGFVDVEGEV